MILHKNFDIINIIPIIILWLWISDLYFNIYSLCFGVQIIHRTVIPNLISDLFISNLLFCMTYSYSLEYLPLQISTLIWYIPLCFQYIKWIPFFDWFWSVFSPWFMITLEQSNQNWWLLFSLNDEHLSECKLVQIRSQFSPHQTILAFLCPQLFRSFIKTLTSFISYM